MLDGEETRGEDMAESVTRAEARSSQWAKDLVQGPGHCALGGLLLTRTIRTTLLSGIEDAVCMLGQIPSCLLIGIL